MNNRSLSPKLFSLLDKGGNLGFLIELVKNDPYLDMEFRGNCVMIYYRGGKLLTVNESCNYEPLAQEYYSNNEQQLKVETDKIFEYICNAKHIIDVHESGRKSKLGEKEFQQRVVFENNLSVNAKNTDFFIADVEWADNTSLGGRADIIAFRWNHMEHRKREVQMTLIEVKQGEDAVETKEYVDKNGNKATSAGLKKHYDDFFEFKKNSKYVSEVAQDMLNVLKQKSDLGLIKGLEKLFVKGNAEKELSIIPDPEFVILLANYHHYSTKLGEECKKLPDDCKFILSSFMGYGLYKDFIKSKKEMEELFPTVFTKQ